MKNAFSCLERLWRFVTFRVVMVFAGAMLGGSLSVQGATAQTIAWTGTSDEMLALGTPYPLGAAASSGLPVTLRVNHGPAVIANGMITASEPGTVWVSAEQVFRRMA